MTKIKMSLKKMTCFKNDIIKNDTDSFIRVDTTKIRFSVEKHI